MNVSRILEEDRLSGEEIRKLLFGRTRTTIREGGYQYWIECSKDGKKTKFWSNSGWTDNGKSWLEGDLYCVQWEKIADGVKICFHIYRNPEGTPEKQDEYFLLGKDGIIPWSMVD